MNSPKTQNVAIAIIENELQQIFITTRLEGKDFSQSLEFPGGKLEPNESPKDAVIREIKEEIAIELVNPKLVDFFAWKYPNKIINLYVYHEFVLDQTPQCLENQSGEWINIEELDPYRFVPGSVPIIDRIHTKAYQQEIDLDHHLQNKDLLTDYYHYTNKK